MVDYIHGTAKRIIMYKIETISTSMKKLADLIYKSALELHNAIVGLRKISNAGPINEACARIKILENHADAIFYAEMSKLFAENQNGVEVLKTMEILQTLEIATDKSEDAAKVLGAILMKNS